VLAACSALLLVAAPAASQPREGETQRSRPVPRQYVCYRSADTLRVDGRLGESAWQAAPWTADFVDIQGATQPTPRFRTRAKMLWDEDYFYVAARMEEPDLWATLTRRDTVIYYDNDFEVFIDPDGDTHNYYELEVNAFETVWDLMLLKPYRDGGPAVDAWDIRGLKVAVQTDGTLDDPGDRDRGWTVEIALPWAVLEEAAPGGAPPDAGAQWRVNFSRVQWPLTVEGSTYRKRTDPDTGEPLPEDNWVWSPQGAIDMHRPEKWGYVQFAETVAGRGKQAFRKRPNERVKNALRELYYRQRRFREANGHYARRLREIEASEIAVEGTNFAPNVVNTGSGYVLSAEGFGGVTVCLRQDGHVWIE
jgi:hypothetical protein